MTDVDSVIGSDRRGSALNGNGVEAIAENAKSTI